MAVFAAVFLCISAGLGFLRSLESDWKWSVFNWSLSSCPYKVLYLDYHFLLFPAIPLTAYGPMAAAAAAAAVVRGENMKKMQRNGYLANVQLLSLGPLDTRRNDVQHKRWLSQIHPLRTMNVCKKKKAFFSFNQRWRRIKVVLIFMHRLDPVSLCWILRYEQPRPDGRPVWNSQSGVSCQQLPQRCQPCPEHWIQP